MCWFYEVHGSSAARATTCAFAMQKALEDFPALALKVSIASGEARRFLVGDEAIQCIDTLAGATVTRTATGEHLTSRGEVLVDEVTANTLGDAVVVKEWRENSESKEKFAVVGSQELGVGEQNVFGNETQSLTPVLQSLRSFVHKIVYEREVLGQGTFLTEFRPCVALFVRFTGIDYDSDSAES